MGHTTRAARGETLWAFMKLGGRALRLANDQLGQQMLARLGSQENGIHEVTGSNPVSSTKSHNNLAG